MTTVIAKSIIKKECREKFLELSRELVQATRKEDGCLKYELHQDTKNPLILSMIEIWETAEHLSAHFQTEHFTRIVPQFADMRESSEVNVYQQVI